MNATALQEQLRLLLHERIHAKKLTGLGLAKQTDFEQAYISNFLNRKRSLSLEGMDRVLAAQNLSILDLLSREELNKRQAPSAPARPTSKMFCCLRRKIAAAERVITREAVRDILKFKKSFLRRLRPAAAGRTGWQRFVLVTVDVQNQQASTSGCCRSDRFDRSSLQHAPALPTQHAQHLRGSEESSLHYQVRGARWRSCRTPTA